MGTDKPLWMLRDLLGNNSFFCEQKGPTGFPQKNETGFLAYRSGQIEANYIWHISYDNLYPYLSFEYKNFAERFKERKILISTFWIPESIC